MAPNYAPDSRRCAAVATRRCERFESAPVLHAFARGRSAGFLILQSGFDSRQTHNAIAHGSRPGPPKLGDRVRSPTMARTALESGSLDARLSSARRGRNTRRGYSWSARAERCRYLSRKQGAPQGAGFESHVLRQRRQLARRASCNRCAAPSANRSCRQGRVRVPRSPPYPSPRRRSPPRTFGCTPRAPPARRAACRTLRCLRARTSR